MRLRRDGHQGKEKAPVREVAGGWFRRVFGEMFARAEYPARLLRPALASLADGAPWRGQDRPVVLFIVTLCTEKSSVIGISDEL